MEGGEGGRGKTLSLWIILLCFDAFRKAGRREITGSDTIGQKKSALFFQLESSSIILLFPPAFFVCYEKLIV